MSKRGNKHHLSVFTHPDAAENALIDAEFTLYDVKREIEKLPKGFAIRKLLDEIDSSWRNVRSSRPCYVVVDYEPGELERNRALAFHLKDLVVKLSSLKEVRLAKEFDLLAEIQEVIMAMLNSPLRNCDVGDWEEQIERHQRYCHNRHPVCRYVPTSLTCRMCFAKWAQEPYKRDPFDDGIGGVEGA